MNRTFGRREGAPRATPLAASAVVAIAPSMNSRRVDLFRIAGMLHGHRRLRDRAIVGVAVYFEIVMAGPACAGADTVIWKS